MKPIPLGQTEANLHLSLALNVSGLSGSPNFLLVAASLNTFKRMLALYAMGHLQLSSGKAALVP